MLEILFSLNLASKIENQHAAAVDQNVVAFMKGPSASASLRVRSDISVLSKGGTNENPLDEPKDEAHFASANQILSVYTRNFIQIVQRIDLGPRGRVT